MERGKRKTFHKNRIPRSYQQQENFARNNESAFDEEKAYQALTRYVCEAEVPFPLVGGLTNAVNPNFPFNRAKFEQSCLKIYQEEKGRVMQTMENLDGLISLSMEILRDDRCDYSSYELPEGQVIFDFLCMRAHFIDDNWKPKSWVLYYGDLTHILQNPPESTILKCLVDLHIESKISTIIPGDRFNYDELIEVVKDQIKEKKKLQIKCQPFQIYCCVDLFRQMVEAAFDEIEDIIDKIRHTIIWPKSLPMWHITFCRLQEAIQSDAEGEFLEQSDSEFSDVPSEEEWTKLRYVCRLVEYIYNAAEVLFMTKNPTASLYLHNLYELQASLRKESISPDRLTLATDLMEKFNKYWKDMFLVLAIATVMDPRCKMKYIEFSSLKYEGNPGNSKVTAVLEAIHGIYDDYKVHSLEAQNSVSLPDPKPSDSKPSDPDSEEELPRHTLERLRNCNFGFNCLDDYNEFLKPSSRPPRSELELYLDEPALPWTHDFDLSSWWRTESPKYPILSKMARDLLSIHTKHITTLISEWLINI